MFGTHSRGIADSPPLDAFVTPASEVAQPSNLIRARYQGFVITISCCALRYTKTKANTIPPRNQAPCTAILRKMARVISTAYTGNKAVVLEHTANVRDLC